MLAVVRGALSASGTTPTEFCSDCGHDWTRHARRCLGGTEAGYVCCCRRIVSGADTPESKEGT